jgi:hypothetical protein
METEWPYVIKYEDWCSEYKKTAVLVDTGKFAGNGLWLEDQIYHFDVGDTPYDIPVGDFHFKKYVWSRSPSIEAGVQRIRDDPASKVFIFHFYRGPVRGAYMLSTPKLNPWHEAAVDFWLKKKFNSEPYVVFQWRHEFASPKKVPWCADHLISAAQVLPEVNPTNSRAAILVDMPPPGQIGLFWVHNYQDTDNVQSSTVTKLMNAGLNFYDAEYPNIDSTVSAVRDYLIALKANLFIYCAAHSSDVCQLCTKPGSNYIDRIAKDRRRDGRPNFERWYSLPNHTEVFVRPRVSPIAWEPIAQGYND